MPIRTLDENRYQNTIYLYIYTDTQQQQTTHYSGVADVAVAELLRFHTADVGYTRRELILNAHLFAVSILSAMPMLHIHISIQKRLFATFSVFFIREFIFGI